MNVSVVTEEAWHNLFAATMFIRDENATADFDPDWTIINACNLRIEDYEQYGLNSEVAVIQSLEQKKVIICGTRYAGEIKKSIFYAMNYDMTEVDVFPMHCSANVDKDDETNVALFFGLSGTGHSSVMTSTVGVKMACLTLKVAAMQNASSYQKKGSHKFGTQSDLAQC